MATKRKAPAKVRGVYERTPGSDVWWIQYKQGTVRKREKVGRRGDAIALYQDRKTKLRAGLKLPKNMRHKGITFAQLAEEAVAWSEEHHPKDIRTVKSRMKPLLVEFGMQAAESINPQMIDHWLTDHKAWSPATKNRYRALLSLVYRQGLRNGKVTTNPARMVAARAENNSRIRYLLDDEEARLRVVMKKRYPQHLPALDVGLYAGMRKTEQFTLTWDNVDFERGEIILDLTKNGSSRSIPIHPRSREAFEALGAGTHKGTERVFRSTRGQPLNNPRKWFEPAIQDAKIPNFRWHDLRHTFCSRLAMKDVPIRTIADLAGHKTLSMAMRYSHLSPSHKQTAIEKI
jgi:integrase